MGIFSDLYNWYYYNDDEIIKAQQQIDFFKLRINAINNKTNMNNKDKQDKINRINQTIECIRFTYSI
tara:strand:+ start:4226 stop:4426 length:201 start_codon:yes stop_codon:yes gene_type:complete